jgi:non-ribosomal peptide synthetase component F
MTLLAAFKALLFFYTRQDDIAIGSPIANRDRREIQDLIGLFVNNLVMRTRLSGSLTFQQLLARVRTVVLEAFDHGEVPFEKLVENLQPERDPSHNPLYQVMFILQILPEPLVQRPDLSVGFVPVPTETAKFDICLFLMEADEGFIGAIEYNTDLFAGSTIRRMVTHFLSVLEAVAGLDQVAWFGTGPHETYPDRKRGGLIGTWDATVSDQYVPYIRPQENGGHADVRWLEVTRAPNEAIAVRIELDEPRQVSVTHLRAADLAAVTHDVDVVPVVETIVHIDAAHRGLGTASCGPDTLPEYRLAPGTYRWGWTIRDLPQS